MLQIVCSGRIFSFVEACPTIAVYYEAIAAHPKVDLLASRISAISANADIHHLADMRISADIIRISAAGPNSSSALTFCTEISLRNPESLF